MKPEHIRVPALPPLPSQDHSDCRAVCLRACARRRQVEACFVIMMLIDGPKRFNELKRTIAGNLAADADAHAARTGARRAWSRRTVFPTIPPRVDYELTDLGRGSGGNR